MIPTVHADSVPFHSQKQEQIVRLALLHRKGNLTLPTASSLGTSQTLNYSCLTSYICFQRISNHFITLSLTPVLLPRGTWEQFGHCRTPVPVRAAPLQGCAWLWQQNRMSLGNLMSDWEGEAAAELLSSVRAEILLWVTERLLPTWGLTAASASAK